MMGKTRNIKEPRIPQNFFCRRCFFAGKKEKAPFKGYYSPSTKRSHICSGLSRHLVAHVDCDNYYIRSVKKLDDGKVDYESSLIKYRVSVQPPKRKRKHTSSEIGVVPKQGSPANTALPSGTNPDVHGHRRLNQQVLFNSLRPRLDAAVIDAALSLHVWDPSKLNETQPPLNCNKDAVILPSAENENNDLSEYPPPPDNDNCIDANNKCSHTPPHTNNVFNNQDKATQKLTEKEPSTESNVVPPYPTPNFTGLTSQLIAEIELLNILQKNNLPMNTFKYVMDWAVRCNESVGGLSTIIDSRSRQTVVEDLENFIPRYHYSFKPYGINWLPDNKLVQVQVRSFRQALFSLLTNPMLVKENNFSFPMRDTPFLPADFKLDNDTPITELHHGKWWTQSWKSLCTEPDQILVPIIFYMDGITIDSKSKLTLTPLNMSLGIFNTETRKKPEAWETIYFHPSKIPSSKKTKGPDNVSNLHSGLSVALQSFKDICDSEECLKWDELPYASQKWSVKMKFAIAYVIGDTQLHDQLCCRYASYNVGVKKFCRHCKCDTDNIANPENLAHKNQLWKPNDFVIDGDDEKQDKETFTSISHHRIDNAFHHLEFGCNDNNIHMATPGECLHMHQLGIAMRTVESISTWIGSESSQHKFNIVALRYGGSLHRQSDRHLPKTRFGSSVLNTAMKEGKDYAGMLLCILLTVLSCEGRQIMGATDEKLSGQVSFIELVLGMEEFLQHGEITLSELSSLRKMTRYFLKHINKHVFRNKGMENKLIKNHLFLHVPEYVERWGPLTGSDSSPSESHHKTEIKGPSKNTQRNASTLIEQTWERKRDKDLLRSVSSLYKKYIHNPDKTKDKSIESDEKRGSRAQLYQTENNGTPKMTWTKVVNREKPEFPQRVLEFCCKNILPIIDCDYIDLQTEHHRVDKNDESNTFIFRAHPSYRTDTAQDSTVWYDWAYFDIAKTAIIPCQILCFVYINNIKPGEHSVSMYPVKCNGCYAVVRRFIDAPKPVRFSKFVQCGTVSKELYLFHCDTIEAVAAVVHDRRESSSEDNHFFVVKNRSEWLNIFSSKMKALR